MTLTLQDAQHVSWKIMRKVNDRPNAERVKGWNPFIIVADLLKGAEEVAAIVRGLEGLKQPENTKTKEMLTKELNGLLYSVFVLAENCGVNLEETFLNLWGGS